MESDGIFEQGSFFDDRYEIRSLLGSGSFGHVYRARQLSTGQQVAVKVLQGPAEGADEAKAQRQLERFDRETKLCGELSHPNIVALLDSGCTEAGQPYAVFEYVPGATLEEVLAAEGRLPVDEAVRLLLQVLDALTSAHRLGVVHRDLKPANIIVSGTGALRNAQVLDFGLGGFLDDRRQVSPRITLSQEFMGTPLYAAPEQLRGETASASSDLYAWGLVVLECLSGRHPFEGSNDFWRRAAVDSAGEVELPGQLGEIEFGRLLSRVVHPSPEQRDVQGDVLVRSLAAVPLEVLEVAFSPKEPGPTARGERRQLTVVSCRLRVRPADHLDVEESDSLMRSLHAICAEVAGRHAGYLVSKLGDRVLLQFGYPVARENDARRAASAGLEIVADVERRSAILSAERGVTVSASLGLHTGSVIARSNPDVRRGGVDIVGETPAVAAELDGLAEPGEVLVSGATARLLQDRFELESRGEHRLSGFSQDTPLYRLLSRNDAVASVVVQRSDAPLVGRDLQLALLADALRKAEVGRPQSLVLQGEPGIGKSRLLAELRHGAPDVRWIEFRCQEEHENTPLRPIIARFEGTGTGSYASLRDEAALDAEADRMLRLLLSGEASLEGRPALSPDKERDLTLAALCSFLLALSRSAPTVLAFEDLHWADPTTRLLLSQLLPLLSMPGDGDQPSLLVLMTTRTWTPPGTTVIALERLSRDEILDLVRGGVKGAQSLTDEMLDQIVEQTDGVPLFVEEMARAIAERVVGVGRESRSSSADLPSRLEELLRARLDAVSEEARATTQLAAALGREFTFDILEAISPKDVGTLRDDLTELTGAGLVLLRRSAGSERYLFKHALVREAAHEAMLHETRREWHERIATVLQNRFPALCESQPELIAGHLHEAGEWEAAAEYWHKAAIRGLERGGYEEAARHVQRGLTELEAVRPGHARSRQELEMLDTLGTALHATRGYTDEEAVRTFERARALYEEIGEEAPLSILYGFWSAALTRADIDATGAVLPHISRFADPEHGPMGPMVAESCLGLRSLLLGHIPEAERLLANAADICDTEEYLEQVSQFPYAGAVYPFAWWVASLCYAGKPDQAKVAEGRMKTLAERLDNPYGHAISVHFSALLARDLGDVKRARELAEQQIAYSNEQKIVLWECVSHCIRGWAVALEGDESGVAEAQGAIEMARLIGMRVTFPTLQSYLAQALHAVGRSDEALALIDEAIPMAEQTLNRYWLAPMHTIRGELLLAADRREEGAAELDRALQVAKRHGARWFELEAATKRAVLAIELGDAQTGLELVSAAQKGLDEGLETVLHREAAAVRARAEADANAS